jgi:hypothetical protein
VKIKISVNNFSTGKWSFEAARIYQFQVGSGWKYGIQTGKKDKIIIRSWGTENSALDGMLKR